MPKRKALPPYSGHVDDTLFVTRANPSDPTSNLYFFNADESISFLLGPKETLEKLNITVLHDVEFPRLMPGSPIEELEYGDGRVIQYQGRVFLLKLQPKQRALPGPLPVKYSENPLTEEEENLGGEYWFRFLYREFRNRGIQLTKIESSPLRKHPRIGSRGFLEVTTTDAVQDEQKWFIKTYGEQRDFENEAENNRVLATWQQLNKTDVLLTASFYFSGRFSYSAQPAYFLGFPFVPHVTARHVGEQENFTAEDIARGLVRVLEVFVHTAPGGLLTPDMSAVRFWHKDLHSDQIIFDTTTKKCYLVDFGNSHLEYMEGRKRSITGSSSSVPSVAEHSTIVKIFIEALNVRFIDHPITKAVKDLRAALKDVRLCTLKDLLPLKQMLGMEVS